MKKFFILFIALFSINTMIAKQISENEAAAIASDFFHSGEVLNASKLQAMKVSLAYEFKSGNETMMYAFNNGVDGYVLVSGDDTIIPVLGYSDKGEFDYNTLPDNARAWFDMYSKMIQSIKKGELNPIKTFSSETSVEPLITSKWNQGYPYWNYTPQVNGKQCYTGCPATAMAQIAYYHQWPIASEGSVDYVTDSRNIHIETELNTTFDWANMTDIYSKDSSAESCHAVAELMRDIGYAMRMDYTEEGSGQNQVGIAKGIVDHLGYDKAMRILYALCYEQEDWAEMLKDELNAGRPILYCGYTKNQEGHAFVCDGYDTNGLFHINWGWGGVSDGYFVITALDPESQGMGGANSGAGFNTGQLAIMSIQKPVEGSVAIPYTILYSNGYMEITDDAVNITLENFVNGGYEDFVGSIKCNIVDENFTVVKQFELISDLVYPVFEENNCSTSIPKDDLIADLEDGKYIFYFYTTDSNGIDAEIETNADPFMFEKIDDEIYIIFQNELIPVKYSIDRSSASKDFSEYIFSFDLKNENSSVYNGNIAVSYSGVANNSDLALTNNIAGETEAINVSIEPGETKTINIASGQLHNHMDYTLTIVADDINVSGNNFEFSCGGYHPIEFRDAKVNRNGEQYVLKSKIVNISAEGETYENIISCSLFTEFSFTEVYKAETEIIKLAPFESAEISIPLNTSDLDFGDYRAILSYINDGELTRMAPEELNAIPFVISNLPELRAENFNLECARTSEGSSNYVLSYDITNKSEFYFEGDFSVKFVSNNAEQSEFVTPIENVVLPPGETITVTHSPEYIELNVNQIYQIEIIEENGAIIENNTIEFFVPQKHALEHRDTQISIKDDVAYFQSIIGNLFDSEDYVYTTKINFDIYTANDELVMAFNTNEISIPSGQAAILQFEFSVEALPAGKYYMEMKCDDGTIVYPSKVPELYFEIIDTAIDGIILDNENKFVNVINIDGRIIKHNVAIEEATQGLEPGIYFIGNKKVFVR